MKKIISLVSIFAILVSIFAMPVSVSANYQIIGHAVVDDDTTANEVIFGDTFVNSSAVGDDGHPAKFTYANIPSSHHGLNWTRGVKPASTAQYLGTWSYEQKYDFSNDYYLRMETGTETTAKTTNHNFYVTMPTNTFAGVNSDASSVYVIECDILPGTSDTMTVEVRYESTITAIRIGGQNCTSSDNYKYDSRFNPNEWHHAVAVIDEINGKWYSFIDGEMVRDAELKHTQRSGGTVIRINGNLISNQYCGIDNFVVRKVGSRQLVFDGKLYNAEEENASYNNKANIIASDATSVYLTKLIINESSFEKKYTIMGAVYDNGELRELVPDEVTVEPYGYYYYNKAFSVDSNTSKAKLFIWEEDYGNPVVVSDEFLKSAN